MRIFKNRRGQGMTEYIIIVAVVAIAAIAAFKMFGTKVTKSVESAGSALETGTQKPDNGQ